MEGAILGDYEPDQLKTDEKKGEKRLSSLRVLGLPLFSLRLIEAGFWARPRISLGSW